MRDFLEAKVLDINSRYLGLSTLVLMENAGREVARELEGYERIAIFVGLGNNGGDGLVAARHLAAMGKSVEVYALEGKRSEGCQRNLELLRYVQNVKLELIRDSKDLEPLIAKVNSYDVLVDALLGTGAREELEEPLRSLVAILNGAKPKVVSVDVPTPGVEADVVISLHSAKVEGAKVVGIGVPKDFEEVCGPGDVYAALKRREGWEHKGDFGRVGVVGGSLDYFGAPQLVGLAALKTGADLAILFVPKSVAQRVTNPELIVKPLESADYLAPEDVELILDYDLDVLVVGNGLATKDSTKEAVLQLLREARVPLVLDADALKLVRLNDLKKVESKVLTPHPGEFQHLFGVGCDPRDIRGCSELVKGAARSVRGVVLLKGRVDYVSDGEKVKRNFTGNPGMTVGGTGDVLAGILAAFVAANPRLFCCSAAAAFLCGMAGDLAAEEQGFCLTPLDVIASIPKALRRCEQYF